MMSLVLQQNYPRKKEEKMNDIEKMEHILYNALSDYAKTNILSIAAIENPDESFEHEISNGIRITLDNGSVFKLLIIEES
jgi:hypothetical protein